MQRHTGTFRCDAEDGHAVMIFEFTDAVAATEGAADEVTRSYLTDSQATAVAIAEGVFMVPGIGVVRRPAPAVPVTPTMTTAYRPPSTYAQPQPPRAAAGGERDLYQRPIEGFGEPWTV